MLKAAAILLHYFKAIRRQKAFQNRVALEQWQEKQLQRLFKTVLPKSAFYRERYAGKDMTTWKTVKPITKTDMMTRFSGLNTLAISKDEAMALALKAEETRDFTQTIAGVAVGLSSGTSGSRGLFLVSEPEMQYWSGTMLAKILPGFWRRRERIALFLRANNDLYQTLGCSQRVQFNYFDLLMPLEQHIVSLAAYHPTVLVAPPSMLLMLAKAVELGQLTLSSAKVVSVAEVLEPLDESYLKSVFRQPICQIYQATEGFLGATCDHGTMHLNEDLLIIKKEYLPGSSRRFMPIVTDLFRTTQPLIRYRLNDILVEKKHPCPCGSPFMSIEMIEGRSDDVFYFSSAERLKGLLPVFPDFIRRAIMCASNDIQEYYVIQHSLNKLEVQLRFGSGESMVIEDLVQTSFSQLARSLGALLPEITFMPYSFVSLNGRKLRRIERRFEQSMDFPELGTV